MSWIPKKTQTSSVQTAAPAPAPKSHAHSLETPVVMSVRKLPAPVYATLMDITATGCTLRSLVLMDRDTEVEFELSDNGASSVVARGRIVSRKAAPQGARFEYTVRFEMLGSQVDALARHVRELERRAALARSQVALNAIPTTDQRRGSYRALTSMPVLYRMENDVPREGRIADISCSGIRLICNSTIEIGTPLDLRFTLASSVLDIFPEETAVIDVSGPVPKRVGRPDQRRPFAEMMLKGRVVTRFAQTRDNREVYGIAFVEIDGYQREEIARFTHAVQLSRLAR
jgi:c-di-GMP-binding flagellar brake protein YcgR